MWKSHTELQIKRLVDSVNILDQETILNNGCYIFYLAGILYPYYTYFVNV